VIRRLPETVQTLYSELLDQAALAEAEEAAASLPPPGSFVSKTIRGNQYWYLQRSEAGQKTQIYLGAASPALLEWIERARRGRRVRQADRDRRGELVAMLTTAGAARPDVGSGRVLEVLAERGLFRAGAVLIGTQAYAQYGNVLGMALDRAAVRTADVDLLHDAALSLAIDPAARKQDLGEALVEANPEFLAVPPLDPKQPSSSFKVRGRDLRVDFLTPAGRSRQGIVPIRGLGVAAQALPHLGYLLDDVVRAVVLHGAGVLVNLPDPARFLFHKLWTAGERPATEALKSRKDLAQAAQLLEVLAADRSGDLSRAWKALPRTMAGRVSRTVRSSDELEALRRWVPGRRGRGGSE